MLRFFHRARRKLFSEKGLAKYIIYSVGEITLLVVGILIALQVNNWSNEKADRKKEAVILLEMYRNLQMNVNSFAKEIEVQDSIIQNIDAVVHHIRNNEPYHESLGTKYASIAWTEEFNYANSAFETLKTIGLELVSSDSLRQHIIDLFNVNYLRTSDVIDKVSSAEYSALVGLYFRHVEFDRGGIGVINDLDRLRSDHEFTNMLSSRRIWKVDLIKMYAALIEESSRLAEMIDKEMKKEID